MATQLTFDELFDAEFLDALEAFSLKIARFIRRGRQGEQLSHDRGFGLEFKDFRPYVAGDDMRTIDWNIYRRLRRLFVRVFEEYQDLPLYLLVDRSKSMFFEEKPRVHASLRAGLALASVALSQHDSVALLSFSNSLEVHTKSHSGKHQLTHLAHRMVELGELDNTDLVDAIRDLSNLGLRRGLLVVISDFFARDEPNVMLDPLKYCSHKVLLVQVTKDADSNPNLDPNLSGDIRLVDCETNNAVDLTIDPAVLTRYRRIYEDFNQQVSNFAASNEMGLARLNADLNVLDQLSDLFEKRNLLV